MESVYKLANWVGLPVSELLTESLLKHAWDKWLLDHPSFFVDGQEVPCAQTLGEQVALLKAYHQADFLSYNLGKKIRGAQAEIQEFIKNQPIKQADQSSCGNTSVESVFLSWIKDALYGTAKDALSKPLHDAKALFQSKTPDIYVLKYISHLHAFIKTNQLREQEQVRPAMGYEGVNIKDPFIKAMVKSGKFNNVKTTEWVWHHSDMKIGSKNILKKIYKEEIMKAEKMSFGLYNLKEIE